MNERAGAVTAESYAALQGLRALAPLCIMAFHWSHFQYDWLLPQSHIAVDVFFAVEGFLAASALAQAGAERRFWPAVAQQLLKVYPVYLLALLIAVAVAMLGVAPAFFPDPWPLATIQKVAAVNAVLQPVFLGPGMAVFPLNPTNWALILEIYAFALLVVCRRWLSLPVLVMMVAAGGAIYAGMAVSAHEANPGFEAANYWGGYPRAIFGFFGGVLLYGVTQRFGRVLPRLDPLVVWAMFLGAQFLQVHLVRLPLVLVGAPVIVWLAAFCSTPRWLDRVAAEAGGLACGIYVLHFPILVAFRAAGDYFDMPKSVVFGPLSYLVQLAVVIALAYAVRRFIDEPLRHQLDAHLARRSASAQTAS